MPVSPGCHAAASASALSPVNERLPCGRIPLRIRTISPELASVGPITGTGISARRWRVFRIYHFPACFDQRKNGSQTLPIPVRFVYIGSALPHAMRAVLPWGWWDRAESNRAFSPGIRTITPAAPPGSRPVLPVSPGCPAIRAKRALRLVTSTRTVNRHYNADSVWRGSHSGDQLRASACAAGSGIPPATGRSFPAVRKKVDDMARSR